MNTALYDERKTRIAKAVALETPDRVPVVLELAAFAARTQKISVSKFCASRLASSEAILKTVQDVGGADGVDYSNSFPSVLSMAWLSKVKLPGLELPDDELWQVVEAELMKREDYDRIIAEGWMNWFMSYITERIDPGLFPRLMAQSQYGPQIAAMWQAASIPVLSPQPVTIPFEMLCGGRSFPKFVRDLFQIPDKVQSAMDAMLPHMTPQAIDKTLQQGAQYMWIGGWRSASEMLSQPLWDRFAFSYFERIINEVIEAGIVPILHFDSDWTRDLARFKIFPKGKVILELDGSTDIFKAKEILGDTMCIMGDVPAALLSLGKPDDVHKYCRKLIEEIGPQGFILHPGCDIPIDAKLENVQAMVAAATGK